MEQIMKHGNGCLCDDCLRELAAKARKLYEENREAIDLLAEQRFPLAKEFKELAIKGGARA